MMPLRCIIVLVELIHGKKERTGIPPVLFDGKDLFLETAVKLNRQGKTTKLGSPCLECDCM
ncbi:hypothetical protein SAMN05661091_3595 [Paenibacillus uliginis N3/975]|uniref:Uncharacterized protein n=1 Tax=Paenibacillus uliginis N3/975 TaxID=1313296 RepID=A0A1X7HI33_9BACL|nr:hypothetical protein [Paenibacillus uliginis]SMF87028.1 hypothetical protein SAMN05661091_3595 [Paenibacillus uliginis N3/975]